VEIIKAKELAIFEIYIDNAFHLNGVIVIELVETYAIFYPIVNVLLIIFVFFLLGFRWQTSRSF